jgi:polyphenol oxidase
MIETEHLKHPGTAHGFFTRGGGHSTGIFDSLNCGLGSGDDPDHVSKNREVVARQLSIEPDNLVSAWQVHSADVVHVTKPWPQDQRPKVDGLVCNTKGIAIGVLTADCAPILFTDTQAGVIGACHAGWRGALAGVSTTTIVAMEKLGAKRDHITAVIGPTISKANYEVGPDFPSPFIAMDPDNANFFTPSIKQDHHMFDLPGYLLHRLKQAGIKISIDLDLCTYANESRFYSYRRATHRGERDYGRLISAIALVQS